MIPLYVVHVVFTDGEEPPAEWGPFVSRRLAQEAMVALASRPDVRQAMLTDFNPKKVNMNAFDWRAAVKKAVKPELDMPKVAE